MPLSPPGGSDDAGNGADQPRGEAYLEFQQVGKAMKVTAVDAATGVEVVIMGPASASQNDLKRVALRKLKTQLAKSRDDGESPDTDDGNDDEPGPKGWIA